MSVEKSGYVALIGRPNVGKSTLLNALLDEKISIISSKPQTTRWQILGIKTNNNAQIIFVDTPGLHQESKRAMNRYMNRVASSVIHDADVVLFMIDATRYRDEDDYVLQQLKATSKPVMLVLNKIDKLDQKTILLPMIDALKNKFNFVSIIPISAKKSENISSLENEIIKLLPAGGELFPEDQITDKSIRFQVAEIIREKLIQVTAEELPYTTTVSVERLKEDKKLVEINAIIWVERSGQKVIIIGKGGDKLKKVGSAARRDIEKLLGQKVFLRLWVKVKEHWTDDELALKSLGYE